MIETQPVYSMAEAFEALRMSRATGYELVNSGRLRTYTVGRRRYISGEALIEFVRGREQAEGLGARIAERDAQNGEAA